MIVIKDEFYSSTIINHACMHVIFFRFQAERDFQMENGTRRPHIDSKISKAAKGLGMNFHLNSIKMISIETLVKKLI